MADLWQAALSAWPGKLPQAQPVGVYIDKTRLSRGEHIKPRPGALVLVLTGCLSEWMHPSDTRSCIVQEYGPRDLVVSPVGRLSARSITDVLVFSPGWDDLLPQAANLVRMLKDAEAADIKTRMAEVMCLPVKERVQAYVRINGLDVCRVKREHVARVVGCSREMVSKILCQMERESV